MGKSPNHLDEMSKPFHLLLKAKKTVMATPTATESPVHITLMPMVSITICICINISSIAIVTLLTNPSMESARFSRATTPRSFLSFFSIFLLLDLEVSFFVFLSLDEEDEEEELFLFFIFLSLDDEEEEEEEVFLFSIFFSSLLPLLLDLSFLIAGGAIFQGDASSTMVRCLLICFV